MFWPEWFNRVYECLDGVQRVHFRVDAGRVPGLSFGHLERCLIFSDLLRQKGIESCFFMKPIAEGVRRAKAHGEAVEILDLPWAEHFSQADTFVVDLPYDPEPEVLELCNSGDRRVVFIDDFGRDLFPCEAVLNYSVLARQDMYPRARRHFLGLEYLMVDQEFDALATHAANRDNTIVVTFGGSDPTDLTRKIVPQILAHDLQGFRVVTVLGPGFSGGEDLLAMVEQSGERLEVLCAPDKLLPILAGSAAIVCNGGKTLYECLALGKSVFAVASTSQEAEVIAAFRKKNALSASLTIWDSGLFAESFNQLLRAVIHD